MRKTAYMAGALAVGTASMVIGGTQAFADSSDNDGINIGNDNNASVLPIQLCGNNIAILGAVVPVASPQNVVCAANAPIVEGPGEEPPASEEEPPAEEQPPTEEKPAEEPPASQEEKLPEAPTPVAVQGHHAVTG
ncbi:hypothetical protein EIL87_17840 [Saccharopolyspora rhizosphaerae]|uniref:DUF320 domain-containing protein n=1 Tax=Saccharopolyspora rhizosphaerae TaxID=2492662 RepID=A0A426JPL5_9PSEU|nr:hypothetical protein [Saccharopolyspora rhizosphaerae]RRO15129.1 hypothetical protein EIL87_17840 [Saccharopolyspora rhizosphaerae]